MTGCNSRILWRNRKNYEFLALRYPPLEWFFSSINSYFPCSLFWRGSFSLWPVNGTCFTALPTSASLESWQQRNWFVDLYTIDWTWKRNFVSESSFHTFDKQNPKVSKLFFCYYKKGSLKKKNFSLQCMCISVHQIK